MADPLVLCEVDEKVSIITLNRPDKLNAISHELQHALTEAFGRADADPATSVVLLRAEGRSFCAGYDIGAKGPDGDDWRSDPTKAHAHLQPQLEFEMAPWLMRKPVIASVQGHVLGGGCELVMLCDLTMLPTTRRSASRRCDSRRSVRRSLIADDHRLQEGAERAGYFGDRSMPDRARSWHNSLR